LKQSRELIGVNEFSLPVLVPKAAMLLFIVLKYTAAYKTNSVLIKHHFLRDHGISFVFNESVSPKVQDNAVSGGF